LCCVDRIDPDKIKEDHIEEPRKYKKFVKDNEHDQENIPI